MSGTTTVTTFTSGDVGLLANRPGTGWVQLGVTPAAGRGGELYGEIAGLADELTTAGAIDDFFFMHKPPGMRIRLHANDDRLEFVRDLAESRTAEWVERGVVAHREYGVYEPEYLLFGGEVSMRSVHRVFTADSRALLRVHTAGPGAGPAWAVSLLMMRALLAALHIPGWERLDVADRLRRQAGRGVTDDLLVDPRIAELLARMRGAWVAPTELRPLLVPATVAAVDEYAAAVRDEARRWRADYFTSRDAVVGPREMAAFLLVFHWNRAGLSLLQQHLLTAVLADRPGSDRPGSDRAGSDRTGGGS